MMAGHPGDASPVGLRNIGFTIHVGGKDSAYHRNSVAESWKKQLAALRENDPDDQFRAISFTGQKRSENRDLGELK